MRVTSRSKATPSDGKAIDDLALAVIGMTFTQATAELTACRISSVPGTPVP